jgi:hypothetical protein
MFEHAVRLFTELPAIILDHAGTVLAAAAVAGVVAAGTVLAHRLRRS